MSFNRFETMKNQKLIHQAYLEALKSDCKFKHGAIISKGPKIICRGYNSSRTKQKYLNSISCSTHAEIEVLRIFHNTHLRGKENWRYNKKKNKNKNKNKRIYNLSGYILWVVRVSNESIKTSSLLDSCPCSKCKQILLLYGFTFFQET